MDNKGLSLLYVSKCVSARQFETTRLWDAQKTEWLADVKEPLWHENIHVLRRPEDCYSWRQLSRHLATSLETSILSDITKSSCRRLKKESFTCPRLPNLFTRLRLHCKLRMSDWNRWHNMPSLNLQFIWTTQAWSVSAITAVANEILIKQYRMPMRLYDKCLQTVLKWSLTSYPLIGLPQAPLLVMISLNIDIVVWSRGQGILIHSSACTNNIHMQGNL